MSHGFIGLLLRHLSISAEADERPGMEDGHSRGDATTSPPPPPDPNVDDTTAATPIDPSSQTNRSDVPLRLESEHWDIWSISPKAALQMFIDALEELATTTGDVPPTPPVSRPSTPRAPDGRRHIRRPSSTIPRTSSSNNIPLLHIGSPEAQSHEPTTIEVGAHAEDIALQHAAIARRFFSKFAPPFSLASYLRRFHEFCPHSTAVYLAAAAYAHRLCVTELAVPATNRTVHRLGLAAIRIAAKVLEDNKYTQDRVAKVGGISNTQLLTLEITLCFLLDFDLWVDERVMASRMYLLQQAAKNGGSGGGRGRLSDQFKLRLPPRKAKAQLVTSAG